MDFPLIPRTPSPTGMAVGLVDYDFGPLLRASDFSGVITRQPPGIRQIIRARVPKVGDDGNETSGVPSVLHQAPLGTYTGWNVVADGFFKGQPCGGGLVGGYIPFARTRAERTASGDPRPSLEERYGTREGYLCRVRTAIVQTVKAGFLRPIDASRLEAEAAQTDAFARIAVTDGGRETAQRLCATQVGRP